MILLSDEQAMLRDMARNWTGDRAPVAALRGLRGGHGFDPALYAEMAAMGWPAILVPESAGGVGMDLVSLGLIVEELGRNLVASPLAASAAGAASAFLLGDDRARQSSWLARIAGGETIGALAIDDGNHHCPDRLTATARADGDGFVLEGGKRAVAEGGAADLLLVAAGLEDGRPALFACPAGTDGVARAALSRIDWRDAADIRFQQVRLPGDALLGAGRDYLDAVLDRARAVLAAEMLGGAVQAFDTTLDYLKTRVQFDHPIGSFQALQHRMADLVAELTLARAAVYEALGAIDAGRAGQGRAVSLAKALVGDAFRAMAQQMIQLHGGIGMTDEHDAGLYLKRAHVLDHCFGNAAFHRERYARLLGI